MRVSIRCAAAAIIGFSGPIALPAAAQTPADAIQVQLDQARIIRLPERVSTLVIGNPQVADGTLQMGGLLVVTGKSYGATNIIALDSRGEVLAEHKVTVEAPQDAKLTVWRGAARETWSCAPRCERSVMLGDSTDYFEATVKQVETRNGFAGSR